MRATWLEGDSPALPLSISEAELASEGVLSMRLPLDESQHAEALAQLCEARGYIERDVVSMQPTTPDLGALQEKFWAEHRHAEDEVRFVLAGAGIFDIRSRDDRWMRVEVEAGDLIVVPAGRFHRFALTPSHEIRCLRLFREASGWHPDYR